METFACGGWVISRYGMLGHAPDEPVDLAILTADQRAWC